MTDRPGREIFFVSNSVNELGGITRWTHQMARLFTRLGHRVHIIGITEPHRAWRIRPHPPLRPARQRVK